MTNKTTTTTRAHQITMHGKPATRVGAKPTTNANPPTATIADIGTLSSNRGFRLLR